MIELEVKSGSAAPQRIRCNAAFVSIGRSPQHTVVISDPRVSRQHGEILLCPSGYQYRDLNSTSGTFLQRGAERTLVRRAVLSEGDELVLGKTQNVIRVVAIKPTPIHSQEESVTLMQVGEDRLASPHRTFADNSSALRTIVQFDSMIMDSGITTEGQAISVLLRQIPNAFDGLEYAAVIEEHEDENRLYDYVLPRESAKVRVSSKIIRRAAKLQRSFLFKIGQEGTLNTENSHVLLSSKSRLVSRGEEEETVGICAPLLLKHAKPRYLQLERRRSEGDLTSEDMLIVDAFVFRAAERIENIELVRQNQFLNVNASLGVFAALIGHDIKNYLFFGKSLAEIRNDPLSEHVGLIRGIERARKLAQGMKELTAPGHIRLKTFSIEDMVRAVATEFHSLFGDRCRFEVACDEAIPPITTSADLLSRVVWNLVMNAYHTAENRRSTLPEEPWVRIAIGLAGDDDLVIEVADNAGGIGQKTLEYIRGSFALVKQVYNREEELINVVDAISHMEGFTNSVGLFFTAIAVNDMRGQIDVETTSKKGSVFRIRLPRYIDELKRLLRF